MCLPVMKIISFETTSMLPSDFYLASGHVRRKRGLGAFEFTIEPNDPRVIEPVRCRYVNADAWVLMLLFGGRRGALGRDRRQRPSVVDVANHAIFGARLETAPSFVASSAGDSSKAAPQSIHERSTVGVENQPVRDLGPTPTAREYWIDDVRSNPTRGSVPLTGT